jgi:hypothetical protein
MYRLISYLELLHLEGRADHGAHERTATGHTLICITSLAHLATEVVCQRLLHGRDANRSTDDLNGGERFLGDLSLIEHLLNGQQ